MRAAIQMIAIAAAIVAPIAGLAAYDRSETTQRFTTGTTWSGDSAVFAYTDGRLFRGDKAETLGYFGGGKPRLVAFGCAGASEPLIAMEESDLPACKRIERIDSPASLKWSR